MRGRDILQEGDGDEDATTPRLHRANEARGGEVLDVEGRACPEEVEALRDIAYAQAWRLLDKRVDSPPRRGSEARLNCFRLQRAC